MFGIFLITLLRPARQIFLPTPIVCLGKTLVTTTWGSTTSAGSVLLKQTSPPWRPQNRIQSVFWRIGSKPSLFFIPSSYPFKVLQGPSWRLRRKSSFSKRFIIYRKRLPASIATAPSVKTFKRQHWFSVRGIVCRSPLFPVLRSPLSTPNYANPFNIIPVYAIQTSYSLSFIILLKLKLLFVVHFII